MLQYFRSQRSDLQESAGRGVRGRRARTRASARIEIVLIALDDHACVIVELDDETVGRRIGCDVRTTTALTTWPFLTAAPGIADLTVRR